MIVRESFLDLSTSTGPMRTHVFQPEESSRGSRRDPGLILYSEIFQLTDPVRRLAAQFASRGYLVMAPEVYHNYEPPGTVLGYDDPGKNRGNALKQELSLTAFDEDVRRILGAMSEHPACNGRFGTVGICLGGHLAFRAALNAEVHAAACFYATDLHTGALGRGGNADTLARAAEIHGELLMVYGRQDPHVPREGRRRIYEGLEDAGAWFTWHEFNAAHAFLRDEGERFDSSAAHLCIDLAADLFKRAL